MLRRQMDAHPKTFDVEFQVIYCNTGREYNETLDFVRAVGLTWGVEILWLEYCRANNEHAFKIVSYETAARRDSKRGPFDEMLEWGSVLPNVQGRGCSGQLKVRTMKRYLLAQGHEAWESFIGIRADEADRRLNILAQCPKYITPRFPLCDSGVTKQDVDAFWCAQPFRLDIPNYKGNCDLCFLKARWKRHAIMRDEPKAAEWWIGWERKMRERGVTHDGAQWISGKSYEGTLADSQHPEFDFAKEIDLNEKDIPCSCAVGGYRDEAVTL